MFIRIDMLTQRKPTPTKAHRGIVLPMALILLVIISLVGTLAIRNSTSSERTLNSLRTGAVAQQAAEIGVRYCELVVDSITAGPSALVPASAITAAQAAVTISDINTTTAVWSSSATWSNANLLITVPASFYQSSASSAVNLKNAPVCVVQRYLNTRVASTTGYLITARGFGNDAVFDTSSGNNNGVTQGSEVWLQSWLLP